jgi:hypothetical protein
LHVWYLLCCVVREACCILTMHPCFSCLVLCCIYFYVIVCWLIPLLRVVAHTVTSC